jgi:hypothetical protein
VECLDGWMERKRGREREMVRDLIRITLWQSKGEPIFHFIILSVYSYQTFLFFSLLRNSFKRFFLSNLFLSFYLSQILSLSLLCYFCFIKIYHFPFQLISSSCPSKQTVSVEPINFTYSTLKVEMKRRNRRRVFLWGPKR